MTRAWEFLKLLVRLNIVKTIYFNVRAFGWRGALKLPVYIFGPVKLADMSGKIQIEAENVKRGMIQFGCEDENIIATREPVRISVSGNLTFKGECKFSRAVQLLVWTNGSLEVGNNAWFGSFSKIVSFRSMTIGDNFMGSWECQLFDTDFHFIRDTALNSIPDNTAPVSIGNQVWLGSRVTVLKGTQLPDCCIVAVGSVCNKNYTSTHTSCIMLGGVPAKLLKENVEYISDKPMERKLYRYFYDSANRDGQYTSVTY